MASQKTKVFEHLFDRYWDEAKGLLSRSLMSLEDVADAIRECNDAYGSTLSDRNPLFIHKM